MKILFYLVPLILFSCNESKKPEENSPVEQEKTIAKESEQQVDSLDAVPKAPEAPEVLYTKTIDDVVVKVTKAKVVGKVLYVELLLGNHAKNSLYVMDVQQINYIDDAQARKVEVLKDDQGVYQASPLQTAKGNRLQISTTANGPEKLISLRFPAPPEASATITLNLPDIGTLEGIHLNRP